MRIEDRIRDAITHRSARVQPAADAWDRISKRIEGLGVPSFVRRATVVVLALGITGLALVAVWSAFRGVRQVPVGEPAGPIPSAVSSPEQTVCFESRAEGDFDGDGMADGARLYALVPGGVKCDGDVLEVSWRWELAVERASGVDTVQPLEDCLAVSIDCHLHGAPDFDGDASSELMVAVGPGASVSYAKIYRVENDQITPIQLVGAGDPEGFLTPGPITLGGSVDSTEQSGFYCEVGEDGSLTLIAWQAARDDGESLWRVHFTTLQLRGESFVVTATEDQSEATQLPPYQGPCP